jgi:Thioredoxin
VLPFPSARYLAAQTLPAYIDAAQKNKELWLANYRRAVVPPELLARAAAVGGTWHLLALSEDWCGDAFNTVPVLGRLAELAPNLDLRVLARDTNPDLMAAHLTDGSRSIPVAIVLDADFRERGWWGPRPRELQRWVLGDGRALSKDERYREVRRWYVQDRGRTTLEEIVGLLERVGGDAKTRNA